MPPDEFLAKPRYVRSFMLASMMVQLEAERAAAQAARR